ncbi:aromatase/cyclase [Sorangium sp. So ce542]|uniref:aromatase/cyclase n=1 Tax=Sorangium sp. So ce542 TaxID=3133316 RepID=UPI003F5F3620
MKTVTNEIMIDAPPAAVYSVCTDVERWPEIIPTVLAMQREDVGENELIMTMHVSNDFGTHTSRSHRRYSPSSYRIDSQMLTLPPQIGSMSGTWTVQARGRGSLLTISHSIEAPATLDGSAREASTAQLAATLSSHTELVLSSIKTWVERRAKQGGAGR